MTQIEDIYLYMSLKQNEQMKRRIVKQQEIEECKVNVKLNQSHINQTYEILASIMNVEITKTTRQAVRNIIVKEMLNFDLKQQKNKLQLQMAQSKYVEKKRLAVESQRTDLIHDIVVDQLGTDND